MKKLLLFLLFLPSLLYSAPSGLIGYWKMEMDGLDYSGVQKSTPVGTYSWVGGKKGWSFLNYRLSYPSWIESTAISFPADNFTIAFWFRKDGNADWTNNVPFFGSNTTEWVHIGFINNIPADKYHYIYVWKYSDYPAGTEIVSTFQPKWFVWYFLTYTHSGTHSKLYFNGLLDVDQPAGNTWSAAPTLFRIGCSPVNEPRFSGELDEFMVFNRVLSAGEIWDLYDIGKSKFK